jgi:hypothetical protein
VPNNEYGDFQTPRELAAKVLKITEDRAAWGRVLEPTCGIGNFLQEAAFLVEKGAHAVGIEVQSDYVQSARKSSADILLADIFSMDLGRDLVWNKPGPMLVVGNPPWVTNSQLTVLGSENRPERVNLKNLNGYDAMTGSSNFDIAEYIWLKLISELRDHAPTISLLCKTQVARNVIEYCAQLKLPISGAMLHLIDAKKWFNVAVDAALFTLQVNNGVSSYACELYESLDSKTPQRSFGVVDGKMVADIDAYVNGRAVEGACQIEWRQGMKHDAAAVMELKHTENGAVTSSGRLVEVEEDYLYPLLKCTDVFRDRLGLSKWVVVPQKAFGEETGGLARRAPLLWKYLNSNAEALDGRKSSIYRNRPRFSVFGLGGYSFAPYKIAISGLHKMASFRLVGPIEGRPVFFDDTCYILPFDEPIEAAIVLSLLTAPPVQNLLRSLIFFDSKRPITKKLLQRIDLVSAAKLTEESVIVEAVESALAPLGVSTSRSSTLESLARMQARWTGEVADTEPETGSSVGMLF